MNPNVYIGIFRKEILIKLYSDKVAYHPATTIPLKHMTLPKDLIFSNSECMINLLVIYWTEHLQSKCDRRICLRGTSWCTKIQF